MPHCAGKKNVFFLHSRSLIVDICIFTCSMALSDSPAKLSFHIFQTQFDDFSCARLHVICLLRPAVWVRSALQRPWPRILAKKQQVVMVCCTGPKLINPIQRGQLIRSSISKKLLWAYLWELWSAMALMYPGFLLSHGWNFLLTMAVGRFWLAVNDMTMMGLLETGLNFGRLTRQSTRASICFRWMELTCPKLLQCWFMAMKAAPWRKMGC